MPPFRGGPPRGRGGRGGGGFSRGGGAGGPRGGGRGGFSRGGGGAGSRGNSRGGGRGGARGRGGRGGQRFGRNDFRTSRVQDVDDQNSDSEPEPQPDDNESSESEDDASDESDAEPTNADKTRAYNLLLQTFKQSSHTDGPQRKRRRVDPEENEKIDEEVDSEDDDDQALDDVDAAVDGTADEQDDEEDNLQNNADPIEDDEEDLTDPFEVHFAHPDENELQKRLKSVSANQWRMEKTKLDHEATMTLSFASSDEHSAVRKPIKAVKQLNLKQRLADAAEKQITLDPLEQAIAPYIFNYQDVLCAARTVENTSSLRKLASLHALNHIYKGRDRVLKNTQKLAAAENADELELRDQGFTRPKVLILLETRQACSKYVDALMELCQPEQQENKKRFQDDFVGDEDKFNPDTMPADYRELFEGNDDNDFRLGIKFTRKTVKFFAQFYASDIILASPLGLRRIIEHPDPKKADSDFLSSIEVCILDQADAMLMQNWDHVTFVLSHLNLQPKDAHGCDFSRVRHSYLDGHAQHLRQTILFSAFLTPDLNALFNKTMLNISGKAKYTRLYQGTITDLSPSLPHLKQTFSRFSTTDPSSDPDARFKYLTSAILPSLTRLPSKIPSADGATTTGPGTLLFIPSYLDFVRIRNFFATSTLTQHLSFGAISEYTSVSDSRRARSHFLSGRHAVLLYTGRAHHFHRYRIRGVRRVVMYGVPENPEFYKEMVGGFLGRSVEEGRCGEGDVGVRVLFSRFDALALERVVGSARVGNMLREKGGDTFDFV